MTIWHGNSQSHSVMRSNWNSTGSRSSRHTHRTIPDTCCNCWAVYSLSLISFLSVVLQIRFFVLHWSIFSVIRRMYPYLQ